MESSFNINFQIPSYLGDRANLLIEQEEWEVTTGLVTKAAFYQQMYNILMQVVGASNPVDCGFNVDMSITSIIHVYPSTQTLAYALKSTYGILSSRQIENYQEEEIINFSLSDSASFKYPSSNTPEYSWIGNVYNSNGALIPSPAVSFDGNTIQLSQRVHGALSLSYIVSRHNYTLDAVAREEEGDLFGAVLYAPYTNGISWLAINNPPNADDIYAGNMTCGGGSVGDPSPWEHPFTPPAFAPPVEEVYTYDYCSGDLTGYTKD